MLRHLVFLFLSLGSCFAFADYGSLVCDGGLEKVELRISDMSDITADVSSLKRAHKSQKIESLAADQTDYGVLKITIKAGAGKDQATYTFDNLGSEQCFAVYGAKHSGPATVKVTNSKGDLVDTTCICSVD